VADEKAQNSDKWLNDPAPTFVMEIFGESWTRQGKPEWNIGWFVDEQNETECYVLVWLPNVSIFKVESGATDHPILTYQSADIVDFEPAALDEQSPEMVRWRSEDSESDVRVELSPAGVSAFESVAEPIPEIITSDGGR
jgi:hypothetical protein